MCHLSVCGASGPVGRELQAIGAGSSPVVVPESAIQALALETSTAVATANASILRSTADVYHEITKKVLIRSLTSGEAHTKTLQSALNRFADRGVTTFTDAAGRRWNMQSYVDMAVRTGKSRARMEGRINGYTDAGVDLVLVSSHPACAPQCLPFQGRVLSLHGPAGRREVTKPDGSTVSVDVVANIRDAIARGYKHPNCRHRETAYTPGMKIPRVPDQGPKEYEALQRQRQIERNIRRWKRREAVALTPEEAQYAKARVRVWQKTQREHIEAWPGVLQRRYDREKVYRGAAGVTPKFTPKKEGIPEWLSPPPHVVKGSPLQQTVEAFLSKRQDNLGPSTHVTWVGVKRIAPDPDPRHVNPNYAEARAVGDKGWMHNCVRCTSAWELRRRGADVQAGYGTYWNEDTLRIDQELDKIHGPFVLGRYRLPWQNVTTWVDDQGRTRKPYWYERPNAKTRTKKDNQRTLETFQDSVPDGATGYAIGVWSGRGSGGHIWNWEKKEGRIMFIDAQNGSEHFDPSVYMNYLRGGSLMIGRLDDMIPDVTTLHVIGDMNGGKRYVK
ncbi:hypothetical protein J5O04_11175 [Corynebacterium hindlerae]|uniref:phage minor capsid protein n=1 Tax=Corynebacterium hindlerae TaxID=699041 RepID=UPI001AD7E536|nr:phage minor capsid protein [Corynebacterium hindlerae]QTH59348.1 hypothetical protein J5O04_11175 [Corynebacterium hindlerae]